MACAAFFGLALAMAQPEPVGAAWPIPVALAPIPSEALHACESDDLEKALTKGLRRTKRIRLTGEAEEPPSKLEITECSQLQQQKRTFTSGGGPIKGPVAGGGIGLGADSGVGLERESMRLVILRARIVTGPRYIEVESGQKDRTLSEAVDTLRHAIDKALSERGEWLFGLGQ